MKNLDNSRLLPLVEQCQAQGPRWAEAFDELASECAPLINGAVGKRSNYPEHVREDIRQAALMGLWEAVLRYDPHHEAGKSFATVAAYRIGYAVENLLSDTAGAVTVPRSHGFNQVGKVLRVLEDYTNETGVTSPEEVLTDAELEEMSGVRHARAILSAFGPESLDTSASGADGGEYVHPEAPLSQSAEADVLADMAEAERQDVLDTVEAMLQHPNDPDARKALADGFCERWAYDSDTSARMRRAASNRLRRERGAA